MKLIYYKNCMLVRKPILLEYNKVLAGVQVKKFVEGVK